MRTLLFLYGILGLLAGQARAAEPATMTVVPDLVYAETGARALALDLYLPPQPATGAAPPLIVWVHGGAWRVGNKDNPPILGIVSHGFALASIDFRNSPEAVFPAQIHDIRAAIRYLRAEAARHGYDGNRIALWGHSSGAHLASLAALTAGNPVLEGEPGAHGDTDAAVQAVIGYSGPSNLGSILHQSTPHGVNVRAPSMAGLLGRPVEDPEIADLVRLASPALQVGADAPPLLLMHGVQDNQVPINQSIELQKAYERAGRHVETEWLVEATHGSGEYFRSPYLEQAADFLRRNLGSP